MMAPTLIRRAERTAPVVNAVKGTLLDVVTPTEGDTWGEPTGLYTSLNCIPVGNSTDICSPGTKTYSSPEIIDGFRFSVYTGFTCKSVGLDWEEINQQIQHISIVRESVPIEESFMASPAFQGATDLTPAAGATPEVGLALLEADMAANYGAGMIHMPRAIAAALLFGAKGALVLEGNKLYTAFGTPVAASGGYDVDNLGPGADTPDAGDYWMWATGLVQLARTPWIVPGPQVKTSTNDVSVLAERTYTASVDCFASAVKVTLS